MEMINSNPTELTSVDSGFCTTPSLIASGGHRAAAFDVALFFIWPEGPKQNSPRQSEAAPWVRVV